MSGDGLMGVSVAEKGVTGEVVGWVTVILLGCHARLVFPLGEVVCSWGSVYLIHSLNSCRMGQRDLLGFVKGFGVDLWG